MDGAFDAVAREGTTASVRGAPCPARTRGAGIGAGSGRVLRSLLSSPIELSSELVELALLTCCDRGRCRCCQVRCLRGRCCRERSHWTTRLSWLDQAAPSLRAGRPCRRPCRQLTRPRRPHPRRASCRNQTWRPRKPLRRDQDRVECSEQRWRRTHRGYVRPRRRSVLRWVRRWVRRSVSRSVRPLARRWPRPSAPPVARRSPVRRWAHPLARRWVRRSA